MKNKKDKKMRTEIEREEETDLVEPTDLQDEPTETDLVEPIEPIEPIEAIKPIEDISIDKKIRFFLFPKIYMDGIKSKQDLDLSQGKEFENEDEALGRVTSSRFLIHFYEDETWDMKNHK